MVVGVLCVAAHSVYMEAYFSHELKNTMITQQRLIMIFV